MKWPIDPSSRRKTSSTRSSRLGVRSRVSCSASTFRRLNARSRNVLVVSNALSVIATLPGAHHKPKPALRTLDRTPAPLHDGARQMAAVVLQPTSIVDDRFVLEVEAKRGG